LTPKLLNAIQQRLLVTHDLFVRGTCLPFVACVFHAPQNFGGSITGMCPNS